MKIGITGDTHGYMACLEQILQLAPDVDMWLHTGDHAEDAFELESLTDVRVIGVLGNCDYDAKQAHIDEFLELEGYKIWLTHGHRYMGTGRIEDLAWWAKKLEADIVIYGHTHVPMNEYYGEKLLINPGSPARPRGGSKPSFAVLTLVKGQKPSVEFVELPERERSYFSIF